MPPFPPVGAEQASLQRFATRLFCLALASCLFAGNGFADPSKGPEPVHAAKPGQAPIARPADFASAPLVPQTRYTVRKQIESIEPTSWLEQYGKVRVRELKR